MRTSGEKERILDEAERVQQSVSFYSNHWFHIFIYDHCRGYIHNFIVCRVARWPACHRPGRYFTANFAVAGNRLVFWKPEPEAGIFKINNLPLTSKRTNVEHGRPQKFFQGEAKSTFCLPSSGCWRCDANGHTQNASLFRHHKANAHCYGNSCMQCFPSKKILHSANVCFSEHGYFRTELAEF